ncbi:hypothetical protein GGI25_004239 [Coemansia spiralis]|uniref:DUF962-domain-containing protein n=2 Tax=Coemansia TaxID=4863 RepID=A0A9W8KXA7_9FUNG|nr:hypothetical protein BX070DRAFT_229299 [Coemansia spiralis]KAJ1994605.1 hypothetical protein EDC05_001522 [Coemansia umbellata]KAJ2624411.1 hypothetical protein GGI26_001546 [Coemansia sp. RSA 1358]KAJ2674776.1 hypothetical protein GGI25_004239 [Coemansia spiralis]
MGGIFDIKTEFPKYGEYHSNKVNVAIHMIFVPTILWSSLGLGAALTPQELFTYPSAIGDFLSRLPGPTPLPNLSTIVMLGYVFFYISLDQVAGLLATPIMYAFLVTSQEYALSSPEAAKVLFGVFVFAWIAQFIGHGVFEKRAPALLDNLVQALVMAPFFVFLEALFACGYRPELHHQLRNEIGKRIYAFRRSHKDKGVKPN